jgi:GNAT superfamily N-acetyltransferase
MAISLRLAGPRDIAVLTPLIERSARALSEGYYTRRQIDAAIRHVFGVDTRLVEDGTYFLAQDRTRPVGCGGWSRRRTLYGGDQRPVGTAEWLDPAVDAARIRASFVAPEAARRGIGRRLLEACAEAAGRAGFTRLALMATLPGVPLYSACGFVPVEPVIDVLPDGTPIQFIRMERSLPFP